MFRSSACLLLFLLVYPSAIAQRLNKAAVLKEIALMPDDTNLVNKLGALARAFRNSDIDSSELFAGKALTLSEKLSFTKGKIQSLTLLGFIHQRKALYAEARQKYEEAFSLAKTSGYKIEEARILASIGDLLLTEQKTPEAMQKYLDAIRLFDELGIRDNRISQIYGQLGQLNLMQGNIKRALEYLYEGLKICQQIKDPVSMAYSEIFIGNVHGETKAYDSSNVHYLAAYRLLEATGEKYALMSVLSNIGQNFNETGDFKKAMDYFEKALALSIELQDRSTEANTYIQIGSANCNLKDYAKALENFNKAITLSKEIGSGDGLRHAFRSKAFTLYAEGEYRMAYDLLERHLIVKDSLFSKESARQIAEMESKYQSEKKELLINKLNAEQELRASEIRKERILKYAGFGGLGAALIIGVLLTIGLVNKRRDNRLIQAQKTEVEKKNEEIELQKHILIEKNNEITDSITYAKRLQNAILPSHKSIGKCLHEYFIYYKPKDIVAGDFYWFEQAGDLVFFAAADCTGHGVPGAMVSMVCSNSLNRSVLEFGLTMPGKILDKTRELVIDTFNKNDEDVKDGMDISLCCLNLKTLQLQWAGANNGLVYFSGSELKELKADKEPIAKYDNRTLFTTHQIQLNKGDTIYLFTDGFADQFGGPKGKKFKHKNLIEAFQANIAVSLREQHDRLARTFDDWKGNLEQVDDVCVMGIRV